MWDARRARNIDDLQYDIGASLVTPEIILSTSKVDGINSIVGSSVVEFKNNRYINNPYHKLLRDLGIEETQNSRAECLKIEGTILIKFPRLAWFPHTLAHLTFFKLIT